ncbi:siderophore-interacting protein [Rhodococcus gannanensis]|jgi:NADPH-dependent ferric siderophore reductase|uniref:Siderophore-interacting protein n=1 Tax=Rhodococcus gannanensis TaxID=1960308 RepID=A0ABW4PBD3_9NOCA
MAKRSKYVKPEHREFLHARVLGSKQISPHFVRVTVGGPDLHSYASLGFDQWFRLFLRTPEQSELRLPTSTSKLWYAQYLAMSKATRPVIRNYTVRSFRTAEAALHGDTPEIDIDFVCHGSADAGDAGPASTWAQSVSPGEDVALLDEGLIHNPLPEARQLLLVGDESALPAIAGILESSPDDARGDAFVEVPDADDIQEIRVPDGMTLHWLPRRDPHDRPGTLALETVRAAGLDLPDYAFVAGEQALASGVRRFLVTDLGMPKTEVAFTGFWRHGHAAG